MNTRAPARTLPVLLLGLVTTATGCAQAPRAAATPASGSLVIVGGGLKDDNRAVYERLVTLAGGSAARIGVIPTASGDGLKAGEESAARWRAFGPASVAVIPLTKDDVVGADDPAVAAAIDACTGLWFTGGDQSRIVQVFRPAARDTRALVAVRSLLARGGVVGGTSAGAAIMTDPMITGGRAASAPRSAPSDPDNPEPAGTPTGGVRTGPGLGLLPVGLVDQHFLERNRTARLLDALATTRNRWGFGISENSAMIVDLRAGWIEAIGPAGVIVIDSSARPPTACILSTGDRVPLPRDGQ